MPETSSVRVPADIDREDELFAGLTARQVAILAAGGVIVWVAWQALGTRVPPLVFLGGLAPLAAAVVAVALGRRDGISLDRYVMLAARHARTPRRQVYAPEGIPAVPEVVEPSLQVALGQRSVGRRWRPWTDLVPAEPVADGISPDGVVDLGRDGSALLSAASTVNFALRMPSEQEALTAAFASWLNSLTGPVHILVRSHRSDLAELVTPVRELAAGLPHPALERAALKHGDFLEDLAASRELLHRQVLLIHHLPGSRTTPQRGRSGTHRQLSRLAADAAGLLAPAEVSITPLDAPAATRVLTAATTPDVPNPVTPATSADVRVALTPEALEVGTRELQVGRDHVATLAVTGYPAEVRPGWLEPLLTYPGRLDVALHIEPVPPALAADRLRKQRARLESTRRMTASRDRLSNPEVDAAAEDATELAYALARGETRLFRTGLYLTVHAGSRDELLDAVARVRSVAESLLLRTQPATWRAVQGWVTTLPLGIDALRLRRTLDTAALAATFPFTSADLPAADPARPAATSGVLYGTNASSPSGLVVWDRWSRDNYNSVTLARAGSGKSYLAKLDLLRQLYHGVQVVVLDPENEYTRLADAVGGTAIHLGHTGVHLNPLTLHLDNPPGHKGGSGLAGPRRQALFLRTFCQVALGGLDAAEAAVLDQAATDAYQAAGITEDPRTWRRPAPTLADVATFLARPSGHDVAAGDLAARLAPYTTGSYADLFGAGSRGTRLEPESHLVVYALRDLADELKPLAMLVALDRIWQTVSGPVRRRRLVVVDEAWLLMRDPASAEFLFRLAKSGRKHWAGLSLITQDAADLLATDLGMATVTNAATQILLRQAPQAIETVTAAFGLSAGERRLLLSAPRGHGLLLAGGGDRVAFRSLASATENTLITTDPAELATLD